MHEIETRALMSLTSLRQDDAEKHEQLVMTNTRLVALCASFDSVSADPEALERASMVYRDLLGSVRSVQFPPSIKTTGAAGLPLYTKICSVW